MFDNFSTVCEALSEIDGVRNLIKTSWLSTTQNWGLPSIVVDFPRLPRPDVLENGKVYSRSEEMLVTLYVDSDNRHPDLVVQEMQVLLPAILTKLGEIFDWRVDFGEIDPIPATFGLTQNAVAIPFTLTITSKD